MWRRRAAFGVISVWGLVSLARLTRLVEPAETPPGAELGPLLDFVRAHIAPSDGYLFVLPGEFGTDTGIEKRLRYELYPRPYDDVRAAQDEASIRQLMRSEGLRVEGPAPIHIPRFTARSREAQPSAGSKRRPLGWPAGRLAIRR